MEPRSGRRLRSAEHLGPGGEDRIGALPDDLLVLVLARLGCVRAAVRTGVLAHRWRGLWARLRHVFFRDVPLPSLKGALKRIPCPPPAVSLLEIRIPMARGRKHRRAISQRLRILAAAIRSLLRAAARLDPEELVFVLPSDFICKYSPMFFLHLPPAAVNFLALHTLSLSGCIVGLDSLLSHCPRLRVLRLKFSDHGFHEDLKSFMSLHSASLQELSVEAENAYMDTVDLVAPQLKQLTVSLKAYGNLNISILAPSLEKLSWQWSYPFDVIKFGLWRTSKLRLQTAESQPELPSLHIHARVTSSVVHGEVENSMQEIEKHMIAKFSILELHLKTKGHVFGALVFHLLGMNRVFSRTRRLKVFLHRSMLKQECPQNCACDQPDWRSQTTSLTALEDVEIDGFEGYDHEIDFLKLIFKCAPMLKRMVVSLSHEVSSRDDGCTQIHNIFRDYSSVECYLNLSTGLVHGGDDCPST
uniref:Uncharacterized protein n=4 Tax=Avena sativa TaxID=4498 RepID=A0ACD6AEZ3_AVESA